jgi:dihydrofolate synthase/folylpolyglutamate synthase
MRAGRPAICSDPDPPPALVAAAGDCGAELRRIGRDFGYVREAASWRYWSASGERPGLPVPALRGAYQLVNAAAAIAALEALGTRLPVHAGAIREGLVSVELAGRFQVLPGRPTVVLDVAHNPHAARSLAATLGTMGFHPRTVGVVGVLRDKDVAGVLAAVRERIDDWYVATLPGPRGATAEGLAQELRGMGVPAEAITPFASVEEAFRGARERATADDRIVVFGSFLTVAAALPVARATAPPL